MKKYTESNGFGDDKFFIIGNSPQISNLYDKISMLSECDGHVLVTGETGTGKELVANNIHYIGKRKDNPFVSVNPNAIPEQLQDSELFGYDDGAFTGCKGEKKGIFELADGGTVFLDEFGNIPKYLQVKILRVLSNGEYRRLGSNTSESMTTKARVVAATNLDINEQIKDGEMREDVFYRIPFVLDVPPLRERGDDVKILAEYFLERFNKKSGKDISFDPRALELLKSYTWPGNVRELDSTVLNLATFCDNDIITLDCLKNYMTTTRNHERDNFYFGSIDIPDHGIELDTIVKDYEKSLIKSALKKTDGVSMRAADLLGLNRKTLVNRINRYGMTPHNKIDEKEKLRVIEALRQTNGNVSQAAKNTGRRYHNLAYRIKKFEINLDDFKL